MLDQEQPEQGRQRARYSTSWGDGVAQPVAPPDAVSRKAFRLSPNQWTALACLGALLFIGLALASGIAVGRVFRSPLAGRVEIVVPSVPLQATEFQSSVATSVARRAPRADSEAHTALVSQLLDQGLIPGEDAPGFQLEVLAGGTVALDDLEEQTVVINFWATWCTWCKYELPALEAVYQKYRQQGLVVLGLNVEEPRPLVEAYAERYGLSFPVMLDVEGATAEAYRVRVLPMTYFVDERGVILRVQRGAMREDELELYVRSALQVSAQYDSR